LVLIKVQECISGFDKMKQVLL